MSADIVRTTVANWLNQTISSQTASAILKAVGDTDYWYEIPADQFDREKRAMDVLEEAIRECKAARKR